MSIQHIQNTKLNAIKRKSVQPLPNRPSSQGMSAEQIKNAFWKFVLDNEDSIVSEIGRIINEANVELDKKFDSKRDKEHSFKNITINENGDLVETDYIHVGDVKIQKGTKDGNSCIEIVFPEES